MEWVGWWPLLIGGETEARRGQGISQLLRLQSLISSRTSTSIPGDCTSAPQKRLPGLSRGTTSLQRICSSSQTLHAHRPAPAPGHIPAPRYSAASSCSPKWHLWAKWWPPGASPRAQSPHQGASVSGQGCHELCAQPGPRACSVSLGAASAFSQGIPPPWDFGVVSQALEPRENWDLLNE